VEPQLAHLSPEMPGVRLAQVFRPLSEQADKEVDPAAAYWGRVRWLTISRLGRKLFGPIAASREDIRVICTRGRIR